jgi:hypothetical protein
LEKLPELSLLIAKANEETDPQRKAYNLEILKNYLYEGFLPIFYMYVKNIHSSYFVNIKKENKSELATFYSHMKKTFSKFIDFS